MGTLNVDTAATILKGIAEGCRQAQCALIGGETAEMPDTYQPGDYDLAGFAVGIVDNNKIIDGTEIRVGHRLIRIPSSGLHSNGYSLVRKICFEINDFRLDQTIPELECTLREELLRPTRIYTEIVQKLIRNLPIHGLAHITGGGIAENVIRIIPSSCGIVVYENAWEAPPIFQFLREAGGVSHTEMLRTFNNGVGFVAVVPESAASDVLNRLEGMNESACVIGEVVECKDPQQRIQWSRM
jgi:phosphoribosylformylglycinamidine cyclo-ligase